MTVQEFIRRGEKNGWAMIAIVKEIPPGSGRKMLFGFEFKKSSRKYRQKYMLPSPILLSELAKGPIKKSTDEKTTATENTTGTAGPDAAADARGTEHALPGESSAQPDAMGSSADSGTGNAPAGTPAIGERPTLGARFQRWLGRKNGTARRDAP